MTTPVPDRPTPARARARRVPAGPALARGRRQLRPRFGIVGSGSSGSGSSGSGSPGRAGGAARVTAAATTTDSSFSLGSRSRPVRSMTGACAASAPSRARSRRSSRPGRRRSGGRQEEAEGHAFAAKYHLTGSWKNKDADKDGLKNLKEFKLGTNPKSADTDKDGLKDADEVVSGNDPTDATPTATESRTGPSAPASSPRSTARPITVREFATGKKVTATVDTECSPADVSADDSSYERRGLRRRDEVDSFERRSSPPTPRPGRRRPSRKRSTSATTRTSTPTPPPATTSTTSRRARSSAAPSTRSTAAPSTSSTTPPSSRSRPSARSAAARARRSPPAPSRRREVAERVAQLGQRDHLHVAARRPPRWRPRSRCPAAPSAAGAASRSRWP